RVPALLRAGPGRRACLPAALPCRRARRLRTWGAALEVARGGAAPLLALQPRLLRRRSGGAVAARAVAVPPLRPAGAGGRRRLLRGGASGGLLPIRRGAPGSAHRPRPHHGLPSPACERRPRRRGI